MGPETANYGGDSTTSILAVAQIPLISRRTSAYAQTSTETPEPKQSRRAITRTCWKLDDVEQITLNERTQWTTTRRWAPHDNSTSTSPSPAPDNPRELAEPPLEPFSIVTSEGETAAMPTEANPPPNSNDAQRSIHWFCVYAYS